MQSPYTSTPSGSPGAIRRNGDKESVIVAQRLKLMTQQSPGGSPKTDSSRGGTLKQRPFRSDVVIPERNQKFLPLPHWKPGEQGTLRVYHNFTPTEVDTSNGPLVDVSKAKTLYMRKLLTQERFSICHVPILHPNDNGSSTEFEYRKTGSFYMFL